MPPAVSQCDSEAMQPCAGLVADADNSAAAAIKADAQNRERFIACQRIQLAAVECLVELERGGLLKRRKPIDTGSLAKP